MPMVQRISIRATAALALGASGASAGELPQYEVMGFPISPLQMSVLRSGGIQEELTPEVTLLGMPFSPHQVAVVSARLIARCVCVRAMGGDLMLGSHTHD